MEPFPVRDLVETLCFPRQKGFVHFPDGNEMFRQSPRGLTAFAEENTWLERPKVGIAEFYGLMLLPGTCTAHTVLLGCVERASGEVFNPFSSPHFGMLIPGKALCPGSAHCGTCLRCLCPKHRASCCSGDPGLHQDDGWGGHIQHGIGLDLPCSSLRRRGERQWDDSGHNTASISVGGIQPGASAMPHSPPSSWVPQKVTLAEELG